MYTYMYVVHALLNIVVCNENKKIDFTTVVMTDRDNMLLVCFQTSIVGIRDHCAAPTVKILLPLHIL